MNITIRLDTWIGESDVRVGDQNISRDRDFSDAEILITDTKVITSKEVEAAPNLLAIIRPGVGYDNLPLEYCRKKGIVLAYTPNAPSQSVAELTLGMVFAGLRHFGDMQKLMGMSFEEMNFGIIGLGRIGKRFAHMLYQLGGYGSIFAYDPVWDTTFDQIHGIRRMPLVDVLQYSTVVSLHVPLTDETTNMIGHKELDLMGEPALLINTSRGGIVNEVNLYSHLLKHPDFMACLDVVEDEPYAGPLLTCTNCMITPHIGAMTMASRMMMEKQAIDAAIRIIKGQEPRWIIPERPLWERKGE